MNIPCHAGEAHRAALRILKRFGLPWALALRAGRIAAAGTPRLIAIRAAILEADGAAAADALASATAAVRSISHSPPTAT